MTKRVIHNKKKHSKIGVLTFHRCINYGSFWQAYCLVAWLRRRGINAEVIDYESRRANLAEWKCAYRPLLPLPVEKSDFPHYRRKIEKFFRAFETFNLSPPVALDSPDFAETYELVIVGSDEVWNFLHPWYGGCPLFFGAGIDTRRLISYAATFGNYDAGAGIPKKWEAQLRKFEAISVRDDNSRKLIENSLGFEPETVLDPCLLFPDALETSKRFEKLEPYLAVYGHNFSAGLIRVVRRHAEKAKLKIVSIGYRNAWADRQWIEADPFDFADFILHSEAVATNFFHGCIFALLNEKPFLCETSPYRSNKIRDLMNLTGGEDRIYNDDEIKKAHAQLLRPGSNLIRRNIANLRQKSEKFLETTTA